MTTKIYLFAQTGGFGWDDGVSGNALCEDGDFLAGHFSSNVDWAKHDMGLSGHCATEGCGIPASKHRAYAEHCPGGYELIWVDDPTEHEGTQAAYEKHLAKYAPDRATQEVLP